jgi:hypothetical protein
MLFDVLSKSSSTFMQIVDFLFAVLLNIFVVPFSFIYSLATKALSRDWKLTDINKAYCLWWSYRTGTIKGTEKIVIDNLSNPRTLLTMFVIAAPLLIILALAKTFTDRKQTSEDKQ